MRCRRFFIIVFLLLSLFSCQTDKSYITLQGNALGTTFSIIYDGKTNYSHSIDSLFAVINKSLSTYHPNSIISRINKGDSHVKADIHFIKVFNKARRIYSETDGLFDPTVGTLVNAYGFGPGKPIKLIDSIRIDSLMQWVGFDKVQLVNNQLKKDNPKIYIDFNAIAKGYSIDVISLFLAGKGIKNYLVEVGGELRAAGVNPDNKFWKIGIEKPLTDGARAIETTVELNNQSMATSGNYRKFHISPDGKKYVHTINPKTGKTAQNDLLSATVITGLDCADADGYATSLMVMGFEKSIQFVKNHPQLSVFLIYVDDKGLTQTYSNIRNQIIE